MKISLFLKNLPFWKLPYMLRSLSADAHTQSLVHPDAVTKLLMLKVLEHICTHYGLPVL